jgi:hypothetical protein
MQAAEIPRLPQFPPGWESDLSNDNSDITRRLKQVEKGQSSFDHRLGKISDDLILVGKEIATLKGSIQPRDLPWAVRFILLPLTVVAIISIVSALIHLEFFEIPRVVTNINALTTSVGELQRLQSATLLNSAEQEAKTGQLGIANTQIKQATELIRNAKNARAPAPDSFFQDSFDAIRSLSQAGIDPTDTHRALVQLASYRSALQPEPATIHTAQWRIISSPLSAEQIADEISKTGGTVLHAATPDVNFLVPPGRSTKFTVENVAFVGGTQQLDGLNWSGVTFVGTKIIFTGKFSTSLNKVSFVNCDFIVPNSSQSVPLLEYAALSQSSRLDLTPSQGG